MASATPSATATAATAATAAAASPAAPAKHDPLGGLKSKLSLKGSNMAKFKTLARITGKARRSSTHTQNKVKANRDMREGKPGLFRSCRPVHAFETDSAITVEKNWGQQSCEVGDFLVIGQAKGSTNWRSDVYVEKRTKFMRDFHLVQGTFDEYKRNGTFYAYTLPRKGNKNRPNSPSEQSVEQKAALFAGNSIGWVADFKWILAKSSTGESLRSDGQATSMRGELFNEAFEPCFLEHPAAHDVMMEYIKIMRRDVDPNWHLQTMAFERANSLLVLKPGEMALITSGQFKVGRMGARDLSGLQATNSKIKKRPRRKSYMPHEMRLNSKAFMSGESIGPNDKTTDVVSMADNSGELFVIPPDVLAKFSSAATKSVNILKAESESEHAEVVESPAEKLERVCRAFFRKCDGAGGGSISPLEFARELRKQAKKFGPQFKDWFNRPLVIFEQIDEDGSGEIEEEEFVSYTVTKGDAMLLGMVMGATSHSSNASAKNVEVAQREATDALVDSLRERVDQLEQQLKHSREAQGQVAGELFEGVLRAALQELPSSVKQRSEMRGAGAAAVPKGVAGVSADLVA